jgi:cytochrome c peroxidase
MSKVRFPVLRSIISSCAALTITACVVTSLNVRAASFEYLQPLPEKPLVQDNNPQTDKKIQLGKKLFFDTRLSGNNQVSCNNCHQLNDSGVQTQAYRVTISGKTIKRNPPTLLNIGLQTVLYWDGRSSSLEAQALDHLQDPNILGNTNSKSIIDRLSKDADYMKLFMNAFDSAHPMTLENITKALASFQRALMTPNSPFDQFITGDETAISGKAKAGIRLFNETGCLACHFGVNFAGPAPGPAMGMGDGFYELFPNNLGSNYDKSYKLVDDLGRYEFSNDPSEKYMWRVPSLRNIALTAPYFHNGSAKTLHEAVKIMAKTQTDKVLTPNELDAVVEFLKTLTGDTPTILQR